MPRLGRYRQLRAQAILWWPELLAAGVGLVLFPGLLSAQDTASDEKSALPNPFIPAIEVQADSLLADSLQVAPHSAPAVAADSADVQQEVQSWRLKRRAFGSRSTPVLPGLSYQMDRPREDLADQLASLAPGPTFDLANVGHRQYIGLDGLPATQSTISLDGLDLSSRITGLANLNLLGSFALCDTTAQDVWQRSATGRPGGEIYLQSLRATEQNVVTRIRSYEGFYEFLTTEGDFRRPLFDGGLTMAARQVFTGSRVTGADYRGNLFFWNWDRKIGSWLLQLDQRILRDENSALGSITNDCRLQQSLERVRVSQQRSQLPVLFSFDAWHRRDAEKFESTDSLLTDRGRLRGLGLGVASVIQGWQLNWNSRVEWQDLSTPDWHADIADRSTRLQLRGDLPLGLQLEWKGLLGYRSDRDAMYHDLGLELARDLQLSLLPETRLSLILDAGRRPPTPEQLYVTRHPAWQDVAVDPWWRDSDQELLPNSSLKDQHWNRLELRIHTAENLLGKLDLRAWYLRSRDETVILAYSDTLRRYENLDANYSGMQFWWTREFGSQWAAFATEGVFRCSEDHVSREFATSISEGGLRFRTQLFKGDLHWHTTLGVRYEHGGINSAGNSLWEAPDLWLYSEARIRTFTFFWSVRNLLNADIQHVAGYPEIGLEDRIGVRWTFFN